MTEPQPLLSLSGVSKAYGGHLALTDLSLAVYPNDFVLLLGANGSGKSTLLRVCVGLSREDSGRVDRQLPPNTIGHLGHRLFLYGQLTVRENLRLVADLLALPVELAGYLHDWRLDEWADRRVAELSRGTQTRTALARMFLHSPRNIFLDEPTTALDQHSTELLTKRLSTIRLSGQQDGVTIVATHDIHRLFPMASRVVLLRDGRISADSLELTRRSGISAETARENVLQAYLEANR